MFNWFRKLFLQKSNVETKIDVVEAIKPIVVYISTEEKQEKLTKKPTTSKAMEMAKTLSNVKNR
jgi:hypothetical protein